MEKIKMMIKNFVAGSLWQLFVDCIVRDLVISSSFSWSLETLLLSLDQDVQSRPY